MGRRLQSYVNKYGPVAGPVIYSLLQKLSARASAAARKK